MKSYEKKFPIYENCMINIFGQPGQESKPNCTIRDLKPKFCS